MSTEPDPEQSYSKDSRAKTVEGFVGGLAILSKYMDKGLQTKYWCGAEHDIIYVYVSPDACPETSPDGLLLLALGFHVTDADSWGYFT